MAKNKKQKMKLAGIRAARGLASQGIGGIGAAASGQTAGLSNVAARAIQSAVDKKLAKAQKRISGRGFYSAGRSSVSGRGEYVANSLFVGGQSKHSAISGHDGEMSSVEIVRREYVCDIFSPEDPTAFTNQAYNINPGLKSVFPWLSQLSGNYAEYEMRQMVVEFIPTVSAYSTTGALGTVMGAVSANAGDEPFDSKSQMMSYEGSISGVVTDKLLIGVECDPNKNGGSAIRYVRTGAMPAGQDIKTYDMGVVQIATQGLSATSYPTGTQIGMLFVSYRVRLHKPALYDALGYSDPQDDFCPGAADSTIALPLGSVPRKGSNNTIGGEIRNEGGQQYYYFPDNFSGYVEIMFFTNGDVDGLNTVELIAGSNITGYNCFTTGNYLSTPFARLESTVAENAVEVLCLRVKQAITAEQNKVRLSRNIGTLYGAYFRVSQINPRNGSPNTFVPQDL